MKTLPRLKFAVTFVAVVLLTAVMITKSTETPATFASRGDSSTQASSFSQPHKISNPAAVYCTDMGYEYQVISDGAGGQTDTCTMPNGIVCSAWNFLEGKCGQAYSYCAKQGLGERTATDGKNPFSPEYAVCVDAKGKDVGHVTTLDNLGPKLNRCGANSETPGTSPNKPGATLQSPASSNQPLAAMTGTPPSSWDWRNATYNYISGDWTSPVKNQGNCGSCWAFGAVGQVEAVLNLAASDPNLDEDLAEEYLVSDCSSAGSCCGGWHYLALDFIQNQGIPDEACLPYVSGSCGCFGTGVCSCTYSGSDSCANATCSQRCSEYGSRLSYLDSYGSVSSNQTAIKQDLINYGPLSVAIDVGEGDNYWDGDVFKCSNPPYVDHVVVIVGYDDAGGYWIAKNSWGSGWNGNGYFKVGYGQCLIEDYVYYAHAASTIHWTISGYVRTSTGTGISGVAMNGLPHSPTTDVNGYYSDQVINGWSGTVTPQKFIYTFSPTSLSYTNVTSEQTNQNYTGTYQPSGTILLVDDDDNNPDVRSYYTDTLTALGESYDVWDTNNSDTEPDAATLANYDIVIWFTGDEYGGYAGPGAAGESALSTYLDGGGSLLISSQDYHYDRGLTNFMSSYLGVSNASSDVSQTVVTGAGSAFSGLGPYQLSYPFSFYNWSDAINPDGTAELAFSGDQGNAAVDKSNGVYHTVYLGFPFEALPSVIGREQVMNAFLIWCGSIPNTHSISGYVRTGGGGGIGGVTMNGLPANPVTDANGYYGGLVIDGWSGTVTPQKGGLSFTPASISYSNVTTDQSEQSYTASCATGLLCVQVSNNSGNPVGNAYVEVYTDLNNWPQATGWTDISGWVEFDINAGNYKLVVSSWSDHFLVMRDITAPGLVTVDPSGTVQVNVNALMLDGAPLQGATIIVNPSIYSHRELGYTDSSGSLTAWVTPGTYAFLAWSWDDLYYLAEPGVTVSGTTTSVDLHAAAMPTGQMPITLTDLTDGYISPQSDLSQSQAPMFYVTSGDVVTFSAMNYNIWGQFRKVEGTETWYYYLENKSFSIESGEPTPYNAGGAITSTTVADSDSYMAGDYVSITNTIIDSYDNRITGIYADTTSLSASPIKDERYERQFMLDESGQVKPFSPSGIDAQFWTDVYPHITVTNPEGTKISEAQNWDTWYRHDFVLPGNGMAGTYQVDLSLDTGPLSGMINANDTFNVTPRTCPTDFLCVQVSNNSGNPVVDAYVEVYYTDFTNWPIASNWSGASGWVEFDYINAGDYKLVVSSWSDHFLVMRDITAPGLVTVDPSGTVQVNVNALMLDGAPLQGATIIANPSIYSHGELGYTDSSGSLTAWVTPGTYTFMAWSWNDLYYLANSGVSVAVATNVDLHAAAMPTGQMPITLTDFEDGWVYPQSDQSQSWVPVFWVTNGDEVTFSAMNYNIGGQLRKVQGTEYWYYYLEWKPFSIASGGTYPYTAGGVFTSTTVADSDSYMPGDSVSITNTITDNYNNQITGIYGDTPTSSALPMQDERVFMLDEAGQVKPFSPSGIDEQLWTSINPHITVTDPGSTIISEAQNWGTWFGHDFVLPGDSVLGTYQVDLTLDTGPHNGVITANDTFTLGISLSVSKAGTGSGTVTSNPAGINCGTTCSYSFANNTDVTLTATTATGSTFTGWSVGVCSGTGTCTVTMSVARSVTATFTLNTYTLSVSKSGTGSGTVTSSPAGINCGTDCSAPFNYNTSVTLTATAATGSTFTGWSGGVCSGTGTCTVIMSAVKSVTAIFALTNTAPVANAQSVSTAEDTAKAITLTGTDADGDPLTYSIVSGPLHGLLSGTAPNVTYTPPANYNGSDSFTFKAYDGTLYSAPATVSITVTSVNDAPIIDEGDSINVTMSSTTPFSLTLHATDVDGDTITWSISILAGHGTATASGTGTSKAISYTPALHNIGSDSFVVQVSDGHGGTDTITVNVTITAVEPTSFNLFLPLILR